MTNRSIFAEEWRECLRAQFIHVVRENDQKTLETLKGVMYDVGFREDDLKAMYIEATMRADDMPEDFVPDMDVLKQPEVVEEAAPPAPEPEAPPEPESDADDAPDDDEPPAVDSSGAVQLSLF